TFCNGLTLRHRDTINAAAGGTFMKRGESSRSITFSSPEIAALTQQITKMNKNFLRMSQSNQQVNVVNPSCETCGGPHHYSECQAAGGFTQRDVYAATGNYNAGANQMTKIEKTPNERPQGALPSNIIPNRREDIEVVTTRSGITLYGPSVPSPNPPSSSKEVERDPKTTMDQVRISSSGSIARVPSSVIQPAPVSKSTEIPDELEECLVLADLELANRSIAYPVGIAEDVFVQVGKFTFLADFVIVDSNVDPCIPLILGRPFLRTTRALVDVHGEELTLRVSKEKLTFIVESTSKNPHKHGDESINHIDIIDTTCKDRFHEVLNVQKSIHPLSGSPTPSSDLVVASLFPFLTPFGDSDFLLEETNAFLALDDSIPPEIDNGGIDPNFCTHKILMEDDFKPAVQHQRRVNLKIHEVIKVEVIKLLDDGLIYPISDSPWVSPMHVVQKKGGMMVVTNDNNELIPTRLVTGWRVCIDYQKLNNATRKDHFPLLFMDQMLERLAGNELYCFLDNFFGYFQISIDPQDQKKTTFTCPYGTFAYRRMPFGFCNALGTFQRCEDTNLVLNWEKCHFMVKECIVLSHKGSKNGIEVDHVKVDVIAKLPPPTTVKGIRSLISRKLTL
nr:DNA-directed DNA polymerase [Tanacetum cinerariifolium]